MNQSDAFTNFKSKTKQAEKMIESESEESISSSDDESVIVVPVKKTKGKGKDVPKDVPKELPKDVKEDNEPRPKKIIDSVETIYAKHQKAAGSTVDFDVLKKSFKLVEDKKPFEKQYVDNKNKVLKSIDDWVVTHPDGEAEYQADQLRKQQSRELSKNKKVVVEEEDAPVVSTPTIPVAQVTPPAAPKKKVPIIEEEGVDYGKIIDSIASYAKDLLTKHTPRKRAKVEEEENGFHEEIPEEVKPVKVKAKKY
jgi:hypothetical protein